MGHGGGACGDVALAAGRRGRVAGLLMSPMRLGCTPAPRTPDPHAAGAARGRWSSCNNVARYPVKRC